MDGSTVSVDYLASARFDAAAEPKPAPPDAGAEEGPSFHDVLSALNPLQYLPVVGTIYRAVTGDTIPEGLRIAGSLAFSALTGGPIGIALSAATTVAEKLTGIDPEAIARDVAEGLGLGPTHAPDAAPIQEAGAPLPAARRRAGLASYAQFAQA